MSEFVADAMYLQGHRDGCREQKQRIAALEALRDDCLAIFDLIDQCQLYGCADRVRERIEAARRKAREI